MLVHDDECEKMVLGTIMNAPKAMYEVQEYIDDECFYNYHHKEIWKAIKSIMDRGDEPSIVNINAELQTHQSQISFLELAKIGESTTFYSLSPYGKRLRELDMRRKLWVLGQKLITVGETEINDMDSVRSESSNDFNNIFSRAESGVLTLSDAFKEVFEQIAANLKGGTRLTGTPTGFYAIDRMGGFQPSDLIVIAGESSMGKTAVTLNMAFNASQQGHPIAIYSLEMRAKQLAARILASKSGIPSNSILFNGAMSSNEYNLLDNTVSSINGDTLYFDERSTTSLDSIMMSIRTMVIKHNIKGAVIDYLQILSINNGPNVNPELAMAEAARKLKNLAKELNIWIIALSQLNRSKDDPKPNRNRLRSSGQIFEAADVVMYVYRPEVYGKDMPEPFEGYNTHNMAYLDVDKGRNMGTFQFLAEFDGATTTFRDIGMSSKSTNEVAPKDPLEQHPDLPDEGLPF